jgi:diguanylate cyclase (GGDEF)-like protein/PAS domain S-box-containing protein
VSTLPLARILIVDDEVANTQALCDTLRDRGYETEGATSGRQALDALQARPFDVLLTDLMMPGMDGVELLTAALAVDPQLVGILMTGKGTIQTAVQAMQAGALDYVLKPIRISTILPVLSRAVNVRRLRLENLELRNTVAIHELNQALAHTLDPVVLLDKIADAALSQFEADEASVMLLEADGGSLRVAAVRGTQRDTLLGMRVPVGAGIAGRVAVTHQPLVLQGDSAHVRPGPLHPRTDIQSALSMPMITRNTLIGVLNIAYTRRPRTIPFGQIKALGIFVNAAAAGIEAARLYESERKADARYRDVLHMAADGIISVDAQQNIVVFNGGAERIFGYPADEALGKPLAILLPPDLAAAHGDRVREFAAGPDQSRNMAGRTPLYGRRKDGSLVSIEVGISKRNETDGVLLTAVVRDVTERIRHEQQIARLTRLYAVLSGVNSAIVRIGDESTLFSDICRVATANGGFDAAFVVETAEKPGQFTVLARAGGYDPGPQFLLEDSPPAVADVLQRASAGEGVVLNNESGIAAGPAGVALPSTEASARAVAALPISAGDRLRAIMVMFAAAPQRFGTEEIKLLKEMAGDVSFALDHIAKAAQLDYLATHDPLTDLPNRQRFLDQLSQLLLATQPTDRELAVVMFDLQRFKQINDTLGRQAGDELLRQFARRCRTFTDPRSHLARVGSDVFALTHGRVTEAATLTRTLLEWLERAVADPFEVGGQTLFVSARFGVALFPADGTDAETLFRNAETALKRAKAKNERGSFYTPALDARVAEKLLLENRLRQALERHEFVLHYQPRVELASGRIVGLEALLRWQDPDAGVVPPAQFVPLLEQTGLIIPVGRWVMGEAARAAARLRAAGAPPLRVAVNVSPIQLRQSDFVRTVAAAIDTDQGADYGLEVEITESVLMEDIESNVIKLNELRAMRIGIAIDDFGTGYSSLAYISRLPVDIIKIDRSFITDFLNDANSMSIVQTIISLSHALQRIVVAEGVERKEQADLLRLLRCDQYQGYLFSRPLPLADVQRLILSPVSP